MLSHFLRVLMLAICLASSSLAARELPEFTALVKQNSPAVVNISTVQRLSARDVLPNDSHAPYSDKLLDEWMKKFLDNGKGELGEPPPSLNTNSRGSGFIFSQDGYIVTNQHVVKDAQEIRVKLNDGRELQATVVGSDERTDIALLKVDADHLPILKIGNAQTLEVGEWVLAIGSPFGFDHSATAGIVSAKGRSLPTDNYVPFIQTDVAINPGNSGGPLFNLKGEVVGINSQIYSRSGGFMGVSFAIPMEIALDVINQLKNTGMVSRGWIGVFIQEVNADLASSFKLPSPQGALVAEVMETGPAAQRIKPGDIILSFNGKPIVHAADLPPLVGASVVGSQAHLKVLRDGTAQLLDIPVAELPKNRFIDPTPVPSPNLQRALPETLGMQLSALDTETRAALQMNNGVRVDQVLGEVARRAGMLEGDIITQLDGQSITTPDQFKQVVASLTQQKAGQMIAVLIQRDGIARFLAIKIEANARE